jgi:hypothetical protein
MNHISYLTIVTLVTLLLIMPGCKKETSTPVMGNLFGFVTLYDQYGGKINSGLNNTTVNLYPSGGGSSTAQTDSTGRYTFNNILQGQYTVNFTNPGYGSIVNSALGFLGEGNIDHDIKLSAIPNFTDSTLATPIDTGGYVVLNGTFSGTDIRKRTYVVFVGGTSAVSSAPVNYLTYYTGTANNNLTTFTVKIPVTDLNDLGFASGSTVYFAGYGAATSFASQSEVEDFTTGRLIFNAISPNPSTISFTLP